MALGTYWHRVLVDEPGTITPEPEVGWTDPFVPLDPPDWYCAITPATARDLETIGAGTVISQATHIVVGHYHKVLTTKARLTVADAAQQVHVMYVVLVQNPGLRCEQSRLVCAEVIA